MDYLIPVLFSGKVVASDQFNRVDNAATLGNTTTGQTWQPLSGTWGIQSEKARVYVSSGGNDRAVVNSGKSTGIAIQATASGSGGQSRLIFRVLDGNNELYLGEAGSGQYLLGKRVAGTLSTLASTSITPQSGDVLRVELFSSKIKAYVNGNLIATVSDSFNLTETKHGLLFTSGAVQKFFDNFFVEEI